MVGVGADVSRDVDVTDARDMFGATIRALAGRKLLRLWLKTSIRNRQLIPAL